MMKVIFACAVSAIIAHTVRGDASPYASASQAWVANYVSNYVARSTAELSANAKTITTNGADVISIGDATVVCEIPSDAALRVQSTATSVTNGTIFVWDGNGKYINAVGNVQSTSTNLVYDGVCSVSTNGVLRFAGKFDVQPILIQPSVSYAITNGLEVAQ